MGLRFLLPGFARQFRTDLRVLTSRRWRGGPTLSQRAQALDRVAGSVVIVSLVAVAIVGADRAGMLKLPEVAESAQAATSGPATSDPAISDPAADAPAALDPALAARPLTSAEVRLLQRKLKSLGFDPGGIDGVPGRHTLTALNAYLAAAKLDTVTKINRATAASLLE